MTLRCGDRATFAVEIGGQATPGLRVVDLWAAGRRLTVHDNAAYVPSLTWYMRHDARRVRERALAACPFPGRPPEEVFRRLRADRTELPERFWFMRWSEIVDNVSMYAYLDDDLVITFQFGRGDHPFPRERGEVFVARMPPETFAAVVTEAADLLSPPSG